MILQQKSRKTTHKWAQFVRKCTHVDVRIAAVSVSAPIETNNGHGAFRLYFYSEITTHTDDAVQLCVRVRLRA